MVAKQLNSRQKEVLAWINNGCPDNNWAPLYYKSSARMLEGHELIKIKGSGRNWKATITARGKKVLAGTEPLVKKRKATSTTTATPPQPPAKPKPVSEAVVPPTPPVVIEKWADDLHARLEAAEFRILTGLPINRDDVEVDWEATAKHLSERLGVDGGLWCLSYRTRRAHAHAWGSPDDVLDACLYEVVSWRTAPIEDVLVTRAPKFHTGVKEVLKYSTDVSAVMKPRARRLLHATFTEAEARGWKPGPVENKNLRASERAQREREGKSLTEYGFTISGRPFHVSIKELRDRVERPPTPREIKDHERYREWSPNRKIGKFYDYPYNGLLELQIGRLISRDTPKGRRSVVGELPGNFASMSLQQRWWDFEDEMERRRQALWEKKLELARTRVGEVYRNDVLHDVLSDRASEWDRHRSIIRYLEDMEAYAVEHALDEPALAWLRWCREHAQDHNPMARLRMPSIAAQSSWERDKLVREIAKTIADEEVR